MRLRAFAVPIKLESGTGGYPVQLTGFPLSFTLDDFCQWYWRVKRMRVTLAFSIGCDSTTYGQQTLSVTTSFPLVMSRNSTESDRIADAAAFQDNDSPPEETLLNWNGTSDDADPPNVPINDGRVDFSGGICDHSSIIIGKPWIRGYWSGEQGGDAGVVIPRLGIEITFPGVMSDSGDVLFQFALGTPEYTADPLFYHQGTSAGSFLGKSLDFQWTARLVDFADDGDFTMNSFSLSITADEWFPFENAESVAVYDSATGAEFIDPLTAPVP